MTGLRRCFFIGEYVPPNDVPTVTCMEQALVNAPKGVEVIILDDLNVRIQEPRDVQEEELVMVVENYRLEDMTAQFMTSRSYIRVGCWTWRIRMEDQ